MRRLPWQCDSLDLQLLILYAILLFLIQVQDFQEAKLECIEEYE